MTFRRKLYRRFLFLLLPVIALSGLFAYVGARRQVMEKLADEGVLLASYQAERIRNSLSFVETTSEYLSKVAVLTQLPTDRERFKSLLRETLDGNTQLSAIEIKGLPQGDPIRLRRTEDGRIVEAEKPIVTNPDLIRSVKEQIAGSWIIPSSNSQATHLYHVQQWTGVTVIMEVPIKRLAQPLGEIQRGGAYGFLASKAAVIFTQTPPADPYQNDFTEFCADVVSRDHSDASFYHVTDPLYGEGAWVGTSKVGDLPLVAGVVFLESQNFHPFNDLALSLMATTATALILASGAATSAAKLLSRPLSELSQKVSRLKEGQFHRKIELTPGASKEIKQLTLGFNRMLDDLQNFMRDKEKESASRLAMESELSVASRIQTSIQPGLPFSNEHVMATGISRPARQVGGDFLGVFPVEEGAVGFFIGDVSGKGVPAAIYMAFTASLLEYLGRAGWEPVNCLKEVNRALTQRGEESMFCTCLFGILRPDGTIEYCNAGHHSPFAFEAGKISELPLNPGMPLGVMDGADFESGTLQLERGNRLLFFTDGVTEAMNEEKEEFGYERLRSALQSMNCGGTAEGDLEYLESEVQRFRAGFPANDDLTVLILELHLS